MSDASSQPHTARLLIACPDKRGIVAAVSQFLFSHGANTLSSDQHSTDPENGRFFMRMEFHLDGLDLSRGQFERAFQDVVAAPFEMDWRLWYTAEPKRMAVLVSRYDHCLLDLLWRRRRGELQVEIPLIVSNHGDLRGDADAFGVPFEIIAVEKGKKDEAEAALLARLRGQCDFVVLARYMQILSGDFLREVGVPVINIHHSFLPAFVGANPYRSALTRGVKIIGATAHYVTEELDAGPIIEQDVARVSHRDDLGALVRIGRDIERTVLARAVKAHVEDRVLIDGNKTLVF
ncbi:formyltetrahydrofolate deformylase [Deinococcus peraridilitoris]|uniref:Formyltetrahydrofolate deformylase n=1 Tax=Deinococcus peraridilitoris (strain DSM 19664 / LMG 22246 / CIP 109416 / KR-200) TaxID=937777 RepID=L0A4H8_DEIPD|nr:formyltetrahydrofolate deformylase [Deinococcus peraridilitoris]AFZ68334.1 formyltetrahydrofolate deformylase [Deinococcus peraridilitoris DSM 19664]